VLAHSGRTNSAGCHNDKKNGGYHCHNGGDKPSVPVPSVTSPASIPITVVSVGDGDTIRVRNQKKITTIRLGCIDAPETAQRPWGQQSSNKLKQLLPIGEIVSLRVIDTDRYGRTVAEVFRNGDSINLQMVAAGQSVVYREYLNGCPDTKLQYLQAEQSAKTQKLGFWNQSKICMPAKFRQKRC